MLTRRGWILASVLLVVLLSLVGVAVSSLVPLANGGIVVGTNVIFRPTQSWADLSFSSQQTFQRQVSVGPTGVTFDNVTFGVQKLPLGPPRAGIVLAGWTPWAGNGSSAIQFTAMSDTNTTVWFNITGLRTDMSYRVYVDGVPEASLATSGGVSFSWSAWSSHTFGIVAYVPTPPGPTPTPPDTTPPSAVTDLRVVGWGPNYSILQWTAPGDDGNVGQATTYDARFAAATLNATGFANGTRIPTGTPQSAGTTDTLNVTGLSPDTRYWFALRTADEVPNWSPISDVAEVLTLATWVSVPSIESVGFDSSQAQVEIAFSEPMNHTSVEESLTISPNVPFGVVWENDTRVTIAIYTPLVANTTYQLTIEPHAADSEGTPMAKTFTFTFNGIPNSEAAHGPFGVPAPLAIPMLVSIAGLAAISMLAAVRFVRSQRNVVRLQYVVMTLARRMTTINLASRIKDLRGQIPLPPAGDTHQIPRFRARK